MDARSLVLLGSILTASPSLITVDPTFTDAGAGLGDVVEGATAWGDYDNDGDLDVVLTGLVGSTAITRLYRNTRGSPRPLLWLGGVERLRQRRRPRPDTHGRDRPRVDHARVPQYGRRLRRR